MSSFLPLFLMSDIGRLRPKGQMETKQARMTKNREKAKSETMKKIDLAKKKIDDYFFLGPSI